MRFNSIGTVLGEKVRQVKKKFQDGTKYWETEKYPARHPKESLSRLGIRTPYMSENSISMHLSFIRLMSNSSKVQLKHKLLLRGARIK